MDLSEDTRLLIIHQHLQKKTVREIAELTNIPKSTVERVVQRHDETGTTSPRRKGRCGRKRILNIREERAVSRHSIAEPQATAREIQHASTSSIQNVSVDTIKRTLRRQGIQAYRPVKAPSLDTKKNCRDCIGVVNMRHGLKSSGKK